MDTLRRIRRRLLDCSEYLDAYEDELVVNGFSAWKKAREIFENEARDDEERVVLKRYWREFQKEILGSAGAGGITTAVLPYPRTRVFPPEAIYQSEFLKSLYLSAQLRQARGGGAENRHIEPCHYRVHQKIFDGVFVDWSPLRAQVEVEASALINGLLGGDGSLRFMVEDVGQSLIAIAGHFCSDGFRHKKKGLCHYFEKRMNLFPGMSSYIVFETERKLRLGALNFYVRFAASGSCPTPTLGVDPDVEARFGYSGFIPGFEAYNKFKTLEQRALCFAAHLFAGGKFIDMVDGAVSV